MVCKTGIKSFVYLRLGKQPIPLNNDSLPINSSINERSVAVLASAAATTKLRNVHKSILKGY